MTSEYMWKLIFTSFQIILGGIGSRRDRELVNPERNAFLKDKIMESSTKCGLFPPVGANAGLESAYYHDAKYLIIRKSK